MRPRRLLVGLALLGALGFAVVGGESPRELISAIRGARTGSLAACVKFLRLRHGGEVQIAWHQRDRSATRFGELLEAWRARYA